jgi:uncharacterized protein (DUF2225 family)
MSKMLEHHYQAAAYHHERAAYHYREAEKHEQAEAHEKAALHAYLAHGHSLHASDSDSQAAKLHANHRLHVDQTDRTTSAGTGVGNMGKNVA